MNTKNDDLEYDMEAMRVAYEDKLQKVRNRPCQAVNLPIWHVRNSFAMIITMHGDRQNTGLYSLKYSSNFCGVHYPLKMNIVSFLLDFIIPFYQNDINCNV